MKKPKTNRYIERREFIKFTLSLAFSGVTLTLFPSYVTAERKTILEDILYFDGEKCNGCGKCVEKCPTIAISKLKDKTAVFFNKNNCIGCLLCIEVCENHAIESPVKPKE